MFASTRLRAYPTVEQEQRAVRIAGCCRYISNLAQERREVAHAAGEKVPTKTSQCAWLKEYRNNDPSVAWLKDAPMQVLQQALADKDRAYARFFKGEAAHPRFTKKGFSYSFRDPQNVWAKRVSKRFGFVKVQGLGPVKVRWHRTVPGTIRSATFSREANGDYYIAVLSQVRDRTPAQKKQPPVGIDVGVAIPIATSDGDLLTFTPLKQGEARHLLRLQRQLARQQKGSQNRERTRRQIASLHARTRRRRKDFAEQVSHHLTKNHGLVAREALNVAAMTASARGTVENPGTNVAQKAALNRSILSIGWSQITTRLEQKGARRGCLVVAVPAPYTSQTCPACGHVSPENRVTRSRFCCRECGLTEHADVVGARNVLLRAVSDGPKLTPTDGTAVAARPGYEPGAADAACRLAESSASAGRGSGNKKRGNSAVRGAAA